MNLPPPDPNSGWTPLAAPSVPGTMTPAERVKRHNRRVVAVIAAVFAVLAVSAIVKNNTKASDTPQRPMTLVEAACSYLRSGDSADAAYGYTKSLAAEHPFTFPDAGVAAHEAVAQAQAQGC
jgi:hypothetical protein